MTEVQPGPTIRPPWKVPVAILAVLVIVFVVGFVSQARSLSVASAEDIHYNHKVHVAAGIQCIFCHPGTLNGPLATLPSVRKCAGCHANVQVTGGPQAKADAQKVLDYLREDRVLTWVYNWKSIPDFVRFTHQPHILNGIHCEDCHGNVSQETEAHPTFRLNMGVCISCHQKQQPHERMVRLTTCGTCHY
jgi:hypothetical protein